MNDAAVIDEPIEAAPPAPPPRRIAYRHRLPTRLWHWIKDSDSYDRTCDRCQVGNEGGGVVLAGTVTGPEEATGDDCKKKIALAKVDFSVVPKLVQQAPALLGSPSGKVSLVQLTPGVFCRSHGWLVYVENAGFVEFRLDGKVGKVQKM